MDPGTLTSWAVLDGTADLYVRRRMNAIVHAFVLALAVWL